MKIDILKYKINTTLPEYPFDKKLIINTINPHSYTVAKKDLLFKKALENSDFLLPDGIGIVLAAKVLKRKKIKKIAGADIHFHFIKIANSKELKVMYFGSSENTLNKINDKISQEYPNICCEFISPPFKKVFSTSENTEMIEKINEFKPDILFVGMTAPKQEKWVYENQSKIDAKIICSIGAVFDFYAETFKRPNKIWIKLGLEWFIRLIKEPKRMFTRNFISTPIFLKDLFIAKFLIFFK